MIGFRFATNPPSPNVMTLFTLPIVLILYDGPLVEFGRNKI